MKYLAIFTLLGCSMALGSSTESKHSYLIERLSEAYKSNNALIHQHADKKNYNYIELLTDNYIDHLQYIKVLSDNQLKRKLNCQATQYITESILLKNYIVDLYDRETQLIRKVPARCQSIKPLKLSPRSTSWDEAKPLIYRILSVLNRLQEAPSLIESISGKISQKVLLQYNNNAITANKLLKASPKRVMISQIVPLNNSSKIQRTFYVVGSTEKEGVTSKYLARISLLKKEYGLYVEDIQEIRDITAQNRILTQIEGICS